METKSDVFRVPGMAQPEAEPVAAAVAVAIAEPTVFEELNQIAEELERCRLRNS